MTSRKSWVTITVALCVLPILGIGTGAREVPTQAETTTRLQMPPWAKVGSKSPGAKPDVRIDGALRAIAREFDGWKAARSQQAPAADFRSRHPLAPVRGGYVAIDAVAEGDAGALLEKLTALGLKRGAVAGHLVSGRLPLAALSALEAMPGITAARPAYLRRRAGAGDERRWRGAPGRRGPIGMGCGRQRRHGGGAVRQLRLPGRRFRRRSQR